MKTVCITLGDPCGLGPELVCRHFAEYGHEGYRHLLIGPASALRREMDALGMEVLFEKITAPEDVAEKNAGVFLYEPKQLSRLGFPPGKATTEGGLAAGASLEVAIQMLKAKIADGLVTCPLNKAMLQKAGFDFPGHTEFLATRLGPGPDKVAMHLCGHDPDGKETRLLRVSLVTTHPPLSEVPNLVTREKVLHTLRLTANFVKMLGLSGPVAVCGLNPHAGESGCIGCEEIKTIIPALTAAGEEGIECEGPIPGDTVFHFAAQGRYPAVLAMYHDQGLAPLKLLHFGEAVNVTLGLPMPRTSPDHGTGYDLVGTGKASVKSFRAALDLCRKMINHGKGRG